jgi:F0F1-type ATP synthase membrane subunit b/b'
MTRGRLRFFRLTLFSTLFFIAINVNAAEEGGSTANTVKEAFQWVNFAVLVAVILWVFLKVLPPKFHAHAAKISSAITTATAAKAEADRLLNEAEGKLARLQQEVAQLRTEGQRDAAAEAERIRNATVADIQRIGLAAKAEIEAAERSARLELKAIAAKLAVDGAESALIRELTPQVQESLVSNFVKSLESRPN